MRLAYNLALGLGLAAASPFLALGLARGRYRHIARARLGLGRGWLPPEDWRGAIWVHALSVGEVGSARPLLEALARRFPSRPLALSLSTAQGLALAREFITPGREAALFIRPLDLPWAVRRLVRHLQPSLFCLVEGDIWPNWQWYLGDLGVPRLLVNGRISPSSFRNYQRLGRLALGLWEGFERILVQSEEDYQRLRAVGVEPARLAVGGNLKFDSAPARLGPEEKKELARRLGLAGRTLLVAGSTHPGEEEPCLEAFRRLAPEHPGLALVIAPRDIARGRAVAELARRRGLRVARLSQGPAPPGTEVLVLDRLGLLARTYALARAALVGGTLIPDGGHNLLEPAAQAVPVVFGPHTFDFAEMARQILEAGGGKRIEQGGELTRIWGDWLGDADKAQAVGRAGLAFCRAHRGAVARAVAEAARLLGEDPA